MDVFAREYTDLEVAIDETREVFEQWSTLDAPAPDEALASDERDEPDADEPASDPLSDELDAGEPASDERRPGDEPTGPPDTARAEDGHELRYAQLVLHEWLANLAQHATFGADSPWVRIRIRISSRHVYCAVEDNSEGFDLEEALHAQTDRAQLMPERGMGLRIIQACTDDFSYQAAEDHRHRFEFSIPADHDPWLSTLF
jgi:serine/threonine-protein kinase RsbW